MKRSTRHRERQLQEENERDESEQAQQCPECESAEVVADADRGELICEGCGLVVEEGNIDLGPEWRAFNHLNARRSRGWERRRHRRCTTRG